MYELGHEQGLRGDDSSFCEMMYLLLNQEEYEVWVEGFVDGSFQRCGVE